MRQIYNIELDTSEVPAVANTIKRLRKRRQRWHKLFFWKRSKPKYRWHKKMPPPQPSSRLLPELTDDEIAERSVRPRTTKRLEPLRNTEAIQRL